MPQSKHIAVIGAGAMGLGIAQLFAVKGHEVSLFDLVPAKQKVAVKKIESNLSFLSSYGLDISQNFHSATDRIHLCESLQEAITGARFVVETVEENLEIKQSLFKEMEYYCSPVTILASNTTTLSISDIASQTKIKERVIGTHFWPPPYLIPLVEVMGGQHTLPEVKGYVCDLLVSMGMRPVVIHKEIQGFLGHRLQQALRREALTIVEQGIADSESINEVIQHGMSIRLSALGIFENENGENVSYRVPRDEDSDRASALLSLFQREGAVDKARNEFEPQRSSWPNPATGMCRAELIRQQLIWHRKTSRKTDRKSGRTPSNE